MTYGYIRVSTDKQDIENQKIGIERKARELDTVVEKWISDDGVSGTKEYEKRQLGTLMKQIKEGDIIIVSEISRLARSVFMLFRIVEQITQIKNAVIYSVKESQVLKKNDVVSAIILSAYGTAAQIEREMIVKRTIEGLERRRQNGVLFGRPLGKKNKIQKLDGKQEKIKELIENRTSFCKIASILKVNTITLRKFCKENNIENPRKMNKIQANNEESKYRRKRVLDWLDSQKDLIVSLIKEGKNRSYIYAELNNITPIKKGTFSSWFYEPENSEFYSEITAITKELRLVRNFNCGKNREGR